MSIKEFFGFGGYSRLAEGYMSCQMELDAPKLMAVNVLNKPYTLYLTPGSRDTLTVTKEALRAMARQAIERGTGARALRGIFERIMLDIMYDVPSDKSITGVTLTEACVLGKGKPEICRGTTQAKPAPARKTATKPRKKKA